MKKSKLSKLKKGDYFRFAGKKKVYKFEGKERAYNRAGKFVGWGFGYVPTDDVWSGHTVSRTDKDIEIDFDY